MTFVAVICWPMLLATEHVLQICRTVFTLGCAHRNKDIVAMIYTGSNIRAELQVLLGHLPLPSLQVRAQNRNVAVAQCLNLGFININAQYVVVYRQSRCR